MHFELKEVKHGRICDEFNPFFLRISDDIRELDIEYELFAENLTAPMRGIVHLDIGREDGRKLLEEHIATLDEKD